MIFGNLVVCSSHGKYAFRRGVRTDHRRHHHRHEAAVDDMVEGKSKNCYFQQRSCALENVGLRTSQLEALKSTMSRS